MNCNRCCGNPCEICITVLVGVIVATIIALLFAFNYIPGITTALWVVFGFAVLNLIFLVVGHFSASLFRYSILGNCLCCKSTILLVAIIGTIILSLIALSITLVITDVASIVLIALVGFFATMMVLGSIGLLRCILCGLCMRDD